MKNVARVDPKTNKLMYNPTYDEMYIPKVLYLCIAMYVCVYVCLFVSVFVMKLMSLLCVCGVLYTEVFCNFHGLVTGWAGESKED